MRILIYGINFLPELTGVGKYSGEMAVWLASHSHQVRVITAHPYYPQWKVHDGYPAYRYLKETYSVNHGEAIKIYRTPLWVPAKPSGLKRILHLFSFAASSLPAAILQIKWRPQLIIMIEPTLSLAPTALLLAFLTGARKWLHIQDFEVDAAFEMDMIRYGWMRRMALSFERVLMRGFNRISTISSPMMERLDIKHIPKQKQIFFPNWVDINKIYPLGRESRFRAQLKLPGDVVIALYAGNLGEKQGLEILVEAARLTALTKSLVWVIAGDGSARARLETLAQGMANVIWLPLQPVEQLNELLNLADIHLLPQREDVADLVMPSKLTGMLASGRPVVATATVGTQIYNVVTECGAVASPGDTRQFADEVIKLADDIKWRQELGMRARQYAEKHLQQDSIMQRFESEALALVGVDDNA